MNIRIQILILGITIVAIGILINMIRARKIELKYALSWMFVGICILVLDLCPGVVECMARLFGVAVPINMLFFCGFCFSLIIIFILTVTVSRMSIKIKDLAQQMALMEKRFKQQEENILKEK